MAAAPAAEAVPSTSLQEAETFFEARTALQAQRSLSLVIAFPV
jgi:hypothetical protein